MFLLLEVAITFGGHNHIWQVKRAKEYSTGKVAYKQNCWSRDGEEEEKEGEIILQEDE